MKLLASSERVVCWTKAGCLKVLQWPGWQDLLDLQAPLLKTDQVEVAEEARLGVTAVGDHHLATTVDRKTVLVYSVTTGLSQGEIVSLGPANISGLALEAHSLYVVTGSRVEVWDLTCHTCLAIIQVEDTTPTPDLTTHSTLVHYTTQYI